MNEYICVNIYNTGYIRWLNRCGPICGDTIGYGIYELLAADPRIEMEIVPKHLAVEKMREHMRAKKAAAAPKVELPKEEPKIETAPIVPEASHEELNMCDAIEITVTEAAPEELYDPMDDEIDAAIEALPKQELNVVKLSPSEPKKTKKKVTRKRNEKAVAAARRRAAKCSITLDPNRVYTDDELENMTRPMMAELLTLRGHVAFTGQHFVKGDPLGAAKNDTRETLIEKVKKSQK